MKKFIQRLVIFVLLITGIFLGGVGVILFLNRQLLDKCSINKDTHSVILGDSHTMWSINAGEVNGLENISLNAEGYEYTYKKLRLLLRTNPQVETIFLGVSYHNFSAYYDEWVEGHYFKQFISRYLGVMTMREILNVYMKNPNDFSKLTYEIFVKGLYNYIQQDCALFGSFPEYKMYQQIDSANVKKRVQSQYYEKGGLLGQSEENVHYLNEIINFCKNKHVRIIVLNTPVSDLYQQQVPKEYITIYESFLKNNQLKSYEFTNLNIPDSCFLPDGDHVNYYGSVITTTNFKSYYESLIQ